MAQTFTSSRSIVNIWWLRKLSPTFRVFESPLSSMLFSLSMSMAVRQMNCSVNLAKLLAWKIDTFDQFFTKLERFNWKGLIGDQWRTYFEQ